MPIVETTNTQREWRLPHPEKPDHYIAFRLYTEADWELWGSARGPGVGAKFRFREIPKESPPQLVRPGRAQFAADSRPSLESRRSTALFAGRRLLTYGAAGSGCTLSSFGTFDARSA